MPVVRLVSLLAFLAVPASAAPADPLNRWFCAALSGPLDPVATIARFPLEALPAAAPDYSFPPKIAASGATYLVSYQQPDGVPYHQLSAGALSMRSDRKPVDQAVRARIATEMQSRLRQLGAPRPLPHLAGHPAYRPLTEGYERTLPNGGYLAWYRLNATMVVRWREGSTPLVAEFCR